MRHNYDALLLFNMKNKYLIIVSLLSWANIGLIYLLHLNEIYFTLIGVYKELTTTTLFFMRYTLSGVVVN